ncbi:hypothetical protein SDJN03_08689, partial [Cucurbita argyrosperma subsp. sororia]
MVRWCGNLFFRAAIHQKSLLLVPSDVFSESGSFHQSISSGSTGAKLSSSTLSFRESACKAALVQHEGSHMHLSVKLIDDWSNRSHGFRALIVMEDHSLLLVQQGEIVWSREDGLASIIYVVTSELPVENKGVFTAKVENNLVEWLQVCKLFQNFMS